MRLLHLSAAVFALTSTPAPAQLRCYDTGHSIHCPPGCELLKPPHFPGDIFTWRCRRPAPPPPRFYAAPSPAPLPPPSYSGCAPGQYPVTDNWCCPLGTVYDGYHRCIHPRTEANLPPDPTVPLAILGFAILGLLAWWDHRSRQIAWAREAEDDLPVTSEIDGARTRMDEAARDADEIIARYRSRMRNDQERDDD